ncbi:MAG: alpha/beta fold hydrolase [Mycolicibacterium insubricum]
MVTDTSAAAHVFATTVRATAIGVVTSLSQGVGTLRDAPVAGPASAAEAGYTGTLPKDFVLVGHSLGGTLVMGAAEEMDEESIGNLKGVVLLDAVDMDNAIPDGLDRLSGADYRPVLHISSERYTWNLDGLVGDELQAARPDSFNRVALAGGRHIDALQGGNPILQVAEYIVAGFSKPENIDAVKVLASSWINDMYDGTPPSYNSAGPASATPTLTRMN